MRYWVAMVLLLAGCSGNEEQQATEDLVDGAHSSQDALDWAGVYRGTLPCEDCDGIQVELNLKDDQTYESSMRYQGESNQVFKVSGNFDWSEDGGSIILKDKYDNVREHYKVGENRLAKLDDQGKSTKTEDADSYILSKGDAPLVNTYWKLIELNGKKIKVTRDYRREPHMVLQMDSTLRGHGGCNAFHGSYQMEKGQGIHFSNVLSTLLACQNVDRESEFFHIFETVDTYAIKGDTLTLSKAKMAPVARFVCVYFN